MLRDLLFIVLVMTHFNSLSSGRNKDTPLTVTVTEKYPLKRFNELLALSSNPTLSEDLSSIFRNFLCNPLPYLDNDHPNGRSAFSTLMGILCNEVMACSILGIGDEDPLEKIAAILNHLLNSTVSSIRCGGNNGMNLLSQCLRHTATFLNGTSVECDCGDGDIGVGRKTETSQ
ncbi:hypothetical protein BLNAU_21352 [Blattamonas nauphoetae]|uniref:Uncharacterized protein n=1 Tax=Blattamonas nauphoetae TaxID=2049346 RepID=A0ABQ9WX88_9EUKA|nr:hypothetical protein BLNAU_21352 [Blattamonas nauphoetae]